MRFCPACAAALPHPPAARRPATCGACGARHYRNPKPCAGALVTDENGRVLLMKRAHEPWHGRWDIPGGFCEADEAPTDTAVREVREETGLDVELGPLLGMWLDAYPEPGVEPEDVETTLNVYFTALRVGGEERPQEGEADELRWFAPDELPGPDGVAFPDHAGKALEAWRRR